MNPLQSFTSSLPNANKEGDAVVHPVTAHAPGTVFAGGVRTQGVTRAPALHFFLQSQNKMGDAVTGLCARLIPPKAFPTSLPHSNKKRNALVHPVTARMSRALSEVGGLRAQGVTKAPTLHFLSSISK